MVLIVVLVTNFQMKNALAYFPESIYKEFYFIERSFDNVIKKLC